MRPRCLPDWMMSTEAAPARRRAHHRPQERRFATGVAPDVNPDICLRGLALVLPLRIQSTNSRLVVWPA